MKRNFLRSLLASMLCMTLILTNAGCSGDSGNTSENQEGQASKNTQSKPLDVTVERESITGTISMWTWTEPSMTENIVPGFNEVYPNVTVEHSAIAQEDVPEKLQTVIASGAQPPDVVWAERGVMGKLVALDCWEDLRDYGIKEEDILESFLPLLRNSRDEIIGLDMAPGFAGLAYKRDLAKQYLGTDDPDELEAILPTWEAFFEKGVEVKEASGGTIYMMAGSSVLYNVLAGQDGTAYTKDNKLQLRQILEPIFTKLVEATKLGIVNKHMMDTTAYYASIAGKEDIFYPCATWAPFHVIQPNDPDGNSVWGLIQNPEGGTINGGTLMCVIDSSPNKNAAAAFVYYYGLSYEGSVMKRDKGITPSTLLKSVYEEENFYSATNEFFGGQDIDKKFSEIAQNMNPIRPHNEYDPEISQAINVALMTINSSTDGNLNVDDLITQVEDEVLAKAPELTK